MLMLLAVLALQQSDTTVAVRPGSRLDVESFEGNIRISVWSRSEVRVQAEADEDTYVGISVSGNRVSVRPRSRYGPSNADLRIDVPANIALDVSAHEGDVEVSGVKGEIKVETLEGDITVSGGSGRVYLSSVDGAISLTDATGRIEIHATDGDVTGERIAGEIQVEAIDGAVTLREVNAASVEVSTVDGAVTFEGPLKPEGHYRLGSHDGEVRLITPALDAQVSVSTFSGSFQSDFPVTVSGTLRRGNRTTFTTGNGSAHVELESFDGDVLIRRSGRKP